MLIIWKIKTSHPPQRGRLQSYKFNQPHHPLFASKNQTAQRGFPVEPFEITSFTAQVATRKALFERFSCNVSRLFP